MKSVLINITEDETRAAFLTHNILNEIFIETPHNQNLVGNIYNGKISRILPNKQSAFIDIGLEKNAYLELDVLSPSYRDNLYEGQILLVQIAKNPTYDKGAKLTTNIKCNACHLVLLRDDNQIKFSKKIKNQAFRAQLTALLTPFCHENHGFLVRSSAIHVETDVLLQEANDLLAITEQLKTQNKARKIGIIYAEPALEIRLLREKVTHEIEHIYIDNEKRFAQLMQFVTQYLPFLAEKITFYRDPTPLFTHFAIESAINAALSPLITLDSGITLLIEKTQTMTVIDVNSAAFVDKNPTEINAFHINQTAANAIVQHIKLRQLSGIIIIDFINLKKVEHQKQILQLLKNAFQSDPVKTTIGGFTSLGLVEIARQRIYPTLQESLEEECICCEGKGRVRSLASCCYALYRQIKYVALTENHPQIKVNVAPKVAQALCENRYFSLDKFASQLEKKITINTIETYHLAQFAVSADKDGT